jgi:hypothetical protein
MLATIGWRRKPLTAMSSGVNRPSRMTGSVARPDLFVRLAQGRLFEHFTRLNDAAGQRHLSGVAKRVGANRQDDSGVAGAGENEQQACGVANTPLIEACRPLAPRARRHQPLPGHARERRRERLAKPRHGLVEVH